MMRKCHCIFAILLLNILNVYGLKLPTKYVFINSLSQNRPQRHLLYAVQDSEKAVEDAGINQHIDGGITEANPNDVKYIELAKESLQKYQKDTGNYQHRVLKVTKATEQVVAGSLTRLDFTAAPTMDGLDDFNVITGNGLKVYNNNIITCHSEIWSRPWVNSKIIEVDCWE